ncbi:MAG TPA: UDP-N-acetylmuramate:L-alanyl-gamma-D-glutamyl-meso-diaminopimelate ligase [Candidatus Acidoferrales bacterium]|nr:UDP-N-acetylmuramate:L-alanyl-gamma-D-glutamyl-meso-diaminopimelate ligase [Candidatus Acidoferrales bacterium]
MDQQHVHIIGICGTAMASLAGLLKQRGLKVTGSDVAAYPPMSDFLAAMAIPVAQPYAETNLKPRPDWVVVGNAISRGNVELEHVLDQRIPFRSMPDTLYDFFLRTREPIVIAGTHGKTTSTSMLAWIFQQAGKDPSFLVGGIAENFGSSFALRQGRHFILEGDEYDTAFFDKGPKFLHYFPQAIILTSVEFDHADIYKDLDAVKTAFKRLVNLVPGKGRIIAYDADSNVDECLAKAFTRVERYGLREDSFWRITDLQFSSDRTTWQVLRDGQPWSSFEFALAGEYNVLNATAAAAMASNYGIEPAVIADALMSFKSVKRRLEIRAEIDGIIIIDDFAHHPTAIAATLKALRTRYPAARLWAVFEPRSNTLRRKVLQKDVISSLSIADEVVIASIFRPEAVPENERLTTTSVVNGVKKNGKRARELADADAIVESVSPELQSGDVVAILSNGGFGGIYEKLPRKLEQLRGAART